VWKVHWEIITFWKINLKLPLTTVRLVLFRTKCWVEHFEKWSIGFSSYKHLIYVNKRHFSASMPRSLAIFGWGGPNLVGSVAQQQILSYCYLTAVPQNSADYYVAPYTIAVIFGRHRLTVPIQFFPHSEWQVFWHIGFLSTMLFVAKKKLWLGCRFVTGRCNYWRGGGSRASKNHDVGGVGSDRFFLGYWLALERKSVTSISLSRRYLTSASFLSSSPMAAPQGDYRFTTFRITALIWKIADTC